jgi:hypothetical protein
MMNLKDIAATLAILGSGALVATGCNKDEPSTEVPSGDAAAPADPAGDPMGDDMMGEAKCGGEDHLDDSHCAAEGEEGVEEAEEAAEEGAEAEDEAEDGM